MKALVIGSTGLVGEHLLQLLELDNRFTSVTALVRKPGAIRSTKINYEFFDFDNMNGALLTGDVLFCALGTTRKKAGSKEAQYKIDLTYNYEAAKLAKQNGVTVLAHVSSLGANSSSSNFYLQVKGKLEDNLKAIGFDRTIIVRPSFILGDRKEFRLGEKIGIVIMKALAFLMQGPLKKYRGVQAAKIAKCMIEESCNASNKGFVILESDKIQVY
ncbi:MAG: NAD(P)H-binding protein [Sphingobacteriaceae bacterium]|nr:NAD(P)H-binding protein [Sphingobacteriaceae bacterium]MBK7816913.1 NAD(P)H-binding protein [Sphingobacteriaceae bacterium]